MENLKGNLKENQKENELTLSQRFKLSITLGAIILFVIALVDITTYHPEEIEQAEQTEVEQTEEWYPGKLTEDGDHQEMPKIESDTSHERFKEMANRYGLDASKIRQVEQYYGITEAVVLCITVSETSGGNRGAGGANIGSVGSNDRGDRPTYALMESGLEAIGKTLTNKYLGNIQTLGCLSNAGSCQRRDDNGKRYATSNYNWEANMKSCLSAIYGPIDPATFNIRNR